MVIYTITTAEHVGRVVWYNILYPFSRIRMTTVVVEKKSVQYFRKAEKTLKLPGNVS